MRFQAPGRHLPVPLTVALVWEIKAEPHNLDLVSPFLELLPVTETALIRMFLNRNIYSLGLSDVFVPCRLYSSNPQSNFIKPNNDSHTTPGAYSCLAH